MSIIASGSLTPAEAPSQVSEADYDGATPFTGGSGPPATFQGRVRASVTATVVVVPFAGLGVAVWLAWGRGLHLADILLAAAFYVITGLGVTVGFHRLLTHRSFTAVPALRVALAVAGSMSFGESWHNMHDSDPACARHGAEAGQIDISAAVIRVFERLGWATGVHWPVPARLAARRRNPGPGQPPPALQPGGHQRERPAAPARGLSP